MAVVDVASGDLFVVDHLTVHVGEKLLLFLQEGLEFARGNFAAGSVGFAVFHLTPDNRVQAVEAINAPAEFMAGRQLIASRRPVAPDRLRDLSFTMKDVAA